MSGKRVMTADKKLTLISMYKEGCTRKYIGRKVGLNSVAGVQRWIEKLIPEEERRTRKNMRAKLRRYGLYIRLTNEENKLVNEFAVRKGKRVSTAMRDIILRYLETQQ